MAVVAEAIWALGIPVALVLFGMLAWVVLDNVTDLEGVDDDGVIVPRDAPFATEGIADQVLSPYLIPFLALSFVLLAAAIGAIVLARKD